MPAYRLLSNILIHTVGVYLKEYSFYANCRWDDDDVIYAADFHIIMQHDLLDNTWTGTARMDPKSNLSKTEPLDFHSLCYLKELIASILK